MNVLVDETCRDLNAVLQAVDKTTRVYWDGLNLLAECFPCEVVARQEAYNTVLKNAGQPFAVTLYGLAGQGKIHPVSVAIFRLKATV